MRNKYYSKKVTIDGETFDSKKEAKRFRELALLEKSGAISDLQRQVPFELLPSQRAEPTYFYKRGRNAGKPKPGKVIELGVNYVADFVYIENGQKVVEDTKGFKTKDYILKRKMMLYFHGIRIREV